ncbi:MAG: hypothetical protein OXC37_06390, partial [Bdellovibrionaceae bacterium]|nr:hypothetical protein [Pseudobdellovibrionaceae bacterium]
PDRAETLSRARRGGDSCEDEDRDHECYDLCKEMYKITDDRKECEELTPDNVDAIYIVWEELKRARINGLEDIDLEHFDWFINVSIAGFDYLIRDYKKSDAQDVLQWIAEDEEVAEIMRDEDDDFETLEELLSVLDTRFDFNTVQDPFTEYIDRKTLFEYAIFTGNSTAMDYFMDYFLQTHRSCRSNSSSVPCLTVVCEIGVAIDPRDREGLFDSDIFDDFIADIIDDRVNGTELADGDGEKWIKGTGDLQIDSTSDLDNSWADPEWDPANDSKTICGGLVSE